MRALLSLIALLSLSAGVVAAESSSPAAAFLEARALAEEGRIAEALEALGPVLASAPQDVYVRLERTELLLRAGRLEDASAEVGLARRLAPENADALRLQGRIELAGADRDDEALDSARAAFERLRELDPEDLESLVSLGQVYLASGRAEAAADALAEAVRLRPGHAGIEALLARAVDSIGDAAQAERIQRDRLHREPEALGARLDLADLYARQGRHDEAAELLEEAPALQRAALDLRRRLALQRFLAGDLGQAREIARGVVDAWPSYGGGRLLLARIEIAFGRFAEAEELLAPLLADEPLPSAVAELRLRALEGQGRVDDAAAVLGRQLERAAEDAERGRAALELARLWARHERWAEVLEPAGIAARNADPEVAADGTLLVARALGRLGRHDEALAALGPADVARPLFAARRIALLLDAEREPAAAAERASLVAMRPEADLALAAVYADRARFEEAIGLLESARKRDPESLETEFRLASAYERAGRIEDSIALFRRLVERAPEFGPALNYLGYLWIDRGENLDQALELVDRAVTLDPDNGAYVDSLGWGLYRLGRWTEAVDQLERAARLIPDDPTVLEHLGDAFAAAGERVKALDAYRRAVALSPDEQSEVARKLARLEGGS